MSDLPKLTAISPVNSGSERPHALWTAAAVRETFNAGDLLAGWLSRHADIIETAREEAIAVAIELQEAGLESVSLDGTPALRLPARQRRATLQRITPADALQALSGIPAEKRTETEQIFAQILCNEPPAVDRNDRVQMSAFQVAAQWAQEVGMPLPFPLEEIERDLQRLEFISLLGGHDLKRFVGREEVRDSLLEAWRSTQGACSFWLEGPGGIGKSLTIAKFISDVLDSKIPEDVPDAVFHLDFDRPALQHAREHTILQDLVWQASRWTGKAGQAMLSELADQFGSSTAIVEDSHSSYRSGEESGLDLAAAEMVRALRPDGGVARVIIFVDSFEQVDGFDSTAAASPKRVVLRLMKQPIKLLVIFASRAFSADSSYMSGEVKRLNQLSARDATSYLRREALRAGLYPSDNAIREVRRAVGHSPLSLRLAVSLLEKFDGKFKPHQWAEIAKRSPELRQAALYDRVLRRIHNPVLAKLAMPGLLVRRLTSGVIEHVLAAACQVDLSKTSATMLMQEAGKEGQLFIRDPSDPEALWHRPDVRATMLANLDRDTDQALANHINYRAALYYRSIAASNVTLRAEEIYHLLRLDEAERNLDARWDDRAGERLRRAMDEFPPRARAYLRRKLGASSPLASSVVADVGFARNVGSQRGRSGIDERELRLYFTKELQSGSSTPTILAHWAFEGQRLDVPMGDIYANALVRANRQDDVLALAPALLNGSNAKRVPAATRCSVLCIAAGLLEGRDELPWAHAYWRRATEISSDIRPLSLVLASLIGAIRICRKLDDKSNQWQRNFRSALVIANKIGYGLFDRNVLARETAAELGQELYLGRSATRSVLVALMSRLAETNEAFPSMAIDWRRRDVIAKQLLVPLRERGGVQEVNRAFQGFVYGDDVAKKHRAVATLRDEVDWMLNRSAWPRRQGEKRDPEVY